MAEYIIDTDVTGCDGYCPARERIVRCGDCKHSEEHSTYYSKGKTFLECTLWHWGDETRLEPEPDGFCAWGERRE